MNNPFIALLKEDSRSIMLQTILSTIFFVGLYYVIMRESFVFVLFMFLASTLYLLGFINILKEKQRLFLMLPATTTQLIQALYRVIFQTLAVLVLSVLPFYALASAFDEVSSTLAESIVLYVTMTGCIFLSASLFIFFYYYIKERSYVTLVQFTTLLLVTLSSFSIVAVFERASLHIVWQVMLLVILYSTLITLVYKQTMIHVKKFNLH